MSSESEEEEVAGVRGNLLYRGGRTVENYQVGSIVCSEAGETSAIIGIAELGGRIIAAVPVAAWNKKVALRKLPQRTLGKTLKVDVVGAYPGDMAVPAVEVAIQAWVGVLAMQDETSITYPGGDAITYKFSADGILPPPRLSSNLQTSNLLARQPNPEEEGKACSRE